MIMLEDYIAKLPERQQARIKVRTQELLNEEISKSYKHLHWDYAITEECPVVKGTWVSVHAIAEHFHRTKSVEDVIYSYPELDDDSIREAVHYFINH